MIDAKQTEENDQSTDEAGEHCDVRLTADLFVDPAQKDWDAIMQLVRDKKIKVEGVVVASKDHAGEMHIVEAGDHLVRKGAGAIGGVGLVVGLFAPPLLAATAVGAGAGALLAKFAKHRVESGIEPQLKEVLPAGAATLIAIYDHTGARAVRGAVVNAAKTSVAEIDGKSVEELKAGLAEAQAGLAG